MVFLNALVRSPNPDAGGTPGWPGDALGSGTQVLAVARSAYGTKGDTRLVRRSVSSRAGLYRAISVWGSAHKTQPCQGMKSLLLLNCVESARLPNVTAIPVVAIFGLQILAVEANEPASMLTGCHSRRPSAHRPTQPTRCREGLQSPAHRRDLLVRMIVDVPCPVRVPVLRTCRHGACQAPGGRPLRSPNARHGFASTTRTRPTSIWPTSAALSRPS